MLKYAILQHCLNVFFSWFNQPVGSIFVYLNLYLYLYTVYLKYLTQQILIHFYSKKGQLKGYIFNSTWNFHVQHCLRLQNTKRKSYIHTNLYLKNIFSYYIYITWFLSHTPWFLSRSCVFNLFTSYPSKIVFSSFVLDQSDMWSW